MTVQLSTKAETAGDPWIAAFRRHSALLLRLAATLVQPADADALVADTLFRVATSGRLVQAIDERAYLVRAMVNMALSERRTDVRRERRELWFAGAEEFRHIDVSAALAVHRALRVLSPQQRSRRLSDVLGRPVGPRQPDGYIPTPTSFRPRRSGRNAAVVAAVAVVGGIGLAVRNHDMAVPTASSFQGRNLFLADPGKAWHLLDIDSMVSDNPNSDESVVSHQATLEFNRPDGAAMLITVVQKNWVTPTPTPPAIDNADNADIPVATVKPGSLRSTTAPNEPDEPATTRAGPLSVTQVLPDGAIATVHYADHSLDADAEAALKSAREVTPTEWTAAIRQINAALQDMPTTVIATVGDTIVSRRTDGTQRALCAHSSQRPDSEIRRRVQPPLPVTPTTTQHRSC